MNRRAPFALLLAVFLAAAPARAAELSCDGANAVVEAESSADAQLACAAIEDMRDLFQACGLTSKIPRSLSVVDEIDGPGDCLALYHCEPDRIEVLAPAVLERAVIPDSPLASIPRERLFASLIVHESAHALLHVLTQGKVQSLADQEYVAFALQLESLREDDRRLWLDAYADISSPDRREINGFLAAADPLRFAVKAWRYFNTVGQGCASVRAVVAGERTFSPGR